ncbi:MAG TPA: hypothetical protein VFW25_03130 [Silvibacterium sp.]|nr:hypothetical protein [Silvibacterium sp.]
MTKKGSNKREKPITLNPVSFEDAIRAALETPPERKPKEASTPQKPKPAEDGGLGESGP